MDESSELNRPDKIYDFLIIVNAREKQWFNERISFTQLIVLAFGYAESNANTTYSVTYKKGDNNRPEGIMVEGDSIKVKDDMRFNVTMTNRS
jgi:hypothetical protein